MNTPLSKTLYLAIAVMLFCVPAKTASAQSVQAQISTREAYIGMPVVLQVAIQNASDYEQPVIPEIDGCEVRSAGSPSQSSRISIINGRRSESRSVTMRYLITPQRAGTFEIPALTVNVDGRDQKTPAFKFVATKSETGDLMFVEIEGSKDQVFVGQPLELTLKIWVKPFVDRQNKIKLSEANMWQMLSDQTSWGSFIDRLKELAENNQRPAGQEVLRDNGQGGESAYYLYEIEATVYPKRAGKIDADDVRIVFNYPTKLGKSRDPMAGLFGSSGISSRMQRMMSDDFFGGSPFGNRLSITASRPIEGEASVDSTKVVDVPTAGRPADYRGALGKYKIITQATPTAISAGDPVTLNIGIVGTGPMELVQAPPLSELPSLTDDFKVADQSMAGFVQDDTKLFQTTIRPRREDITEIPPIPFSFFNPTTEKFETVMSEPISISVDKSESLALDAIVGNARRDRTEESSATPAKETTGPDFSNSDSASLLASQTPVSANNWWLPFVVVPPFVWLGTLLVCNRGAIGRCIPSFKSARVECESKISKAKTADQVEDALVQYIYKRTKLKGHSREGADRNIDAAVTAIGGLRTSGLYQLASEVESFLQQSKHSAFSGASQTSLDDTQTSARELVVRLEEAFGSMKKSQVRRSQNGNPSGSTPNQKPNRNITQKTSILLIASLLAIGGASTASATTEVDNKNRLVLSDSQRETIFAEANESYAKAEALAKTDSAESNDLFAQATDKYQQLVESGVSNSRLYINLGNAYLKSNQLGHAIANYERAKQLDPTNEQLAVNLEFANSLVKGQQVSETDSSSSSSEVPTSKTSLGSIIAQVRSANQTLTNLIGTGSILWMLAISSLLFWGMLTIGLFVSSFPMKRLAIIPLVLLTLSASSYGLAATSRSNTFNAVIVVDAVSLRAGDGEQFDAVSELETAQGHRVQIVDRRADWVQIKTTKGELGWISAPTFAEICR